MRSASTSGFVLAMSVWPIVGCGPGRLPDLGFGTAADGASGTGSTSADSPGEASEGPTSSTPDDGDSVGDEQTGDGDSDSSDGTASSTTSDDDQDGSDQDGSDQDGDGDQDGSDQDGSDQDGNDQDDNDDNDTWGRPPDVTNEPCEPLAQDCYWTHKCVPYASQPNSWLLDANKCMPILGDKQWGEPCVLSSFDEGQDDCDGEGFCWNLEWVQGQLHGTCVPFCLGTPQNPFCPLGWGCMFSGAISLCPMKCEPLLQDCPSEHGCFWAGNNFQCMLIGAGGSGQNQSCTKVADCQPGLACVDKALVPDCVGNGPSCCTSWCDLQAPSCPPPLDCVPFFEGEVPAMLADIGMCVVG